MPDYFTTSYVARLACLSLASFFLINSFAALVLWFFSPTALRWTSRFRPQLAARLVLTLRLLPCGLAIFAVLALCIPSYLWLEPQNGQEQMSYWCELFALFGIASFGSSAMRAWRSAQATRSYVRNARGGHAIDLRGTKRFLIVESEAPILAVEGLVIPQVLVSRRVVRELPQAELKVALAHEKSHAVSRDNLKRLLILLAPDAFLFRRTFVTLERAWEQFAEWSADDRAADGDPVLATLLASALVRVSRMGLCRTSAHIACFATDADDLPMRVNRLLKPDEHEPAPRLILAASATILIAIATAALQHSCWYGVHRLLERMIR